MAGNAKQLTLSEASIVGWEKCIKASVLSLTLEVCISFSVVNDAITMELAVVVNGTRYKFTESISGNQCFSIPILGFELETCISKWVIGQSSVSFTLTIYVVVFLKVKIFEEQVTLPLPSAEEAAALESVKVSSPQELTHLLGLVSSVQVSDDGSSQHAAEGGCGCGGSAASAQISECPPNTGLIGSCYEPSGRQIPGRFNCAACCALRAAGFWVGPEGKLYPC
jgi:hypothetical protein